MQLGNFTNLASQAELPMAVLGLGAGRRHEIFLLLGNRPGTPTY